MRGAVPSCPSRVCRPRIIPARAGSSHGRGEGVSVTWDHPRACGEQRPDGIHITLRPGSSPRVRGADVGQVGVGDQYRIIPARAGSSGCGTSPLLCPGDHPRACGEQVMPRRVRMPLPGSSPRVRGAGKSAHGLGDGRGIIPARAGSSSTRRRAATPSRDHPRACGEQDGVIKAGDTATGSSPRVRGADRRRRRPHRCIGIIPARAGSSQPTATTTSM